MWQLGFLQEAIILRACGSVLLQGSVCGLSSEGLLAQWPSPKTTEAKMLVFLKLGLKLTATPCFLLVTVSHCQPRFSVGVNYVKTGKAGGGLY